MRVWAVAICLVMCLSWALAGESVGTVVAIKGGATATNGAGESRDLKLKDPIFQDDTIQTGKRGKLQLMFNDQSIYSLGRKSDLIIKEYAFDGKTGALKTESTQGTFRVMAGKIGKVSPENFKQETPVGTMGIRGSMYIFINTETMTAVVYGGSNSGPNGGAVFTPTGGVPMVMTTPGTGTQKGADGSFGAVAEIPIEIVVALLAATNAGGDGTGANIGIIPVSADSLPEGVSGDDDGDTGGILIILSDAFVDMITDFVNSAVSTGVQGDTFSSLVEVTGSTFGNGGSGLSGFSNGVASLFTFDPVTDGTNISMVAQFPGDEDNFITLTAPLPIVTSSVYTGTESFSDTVAYTLNGAARTMDYTVTQDNLGQFAVFSGNNGSEAIFGFGGSKTETNPAGVYNYTTSNQSLVVSSNGLSNPTNSLYANFNNGKVLFQSDGMVGIGTLSGSAFSMNLIGSDSTIQSGSSTGQFYGNVAQGFGLSGIASNGTFAAAGFQSGSRAASSGSESLEGFMVGLAQNVSNSSDFKLENYGYFTLDRNFDTGTVTGGTGWLLADNAYDYSMDHSLNLTFGASDSAVIDSSLMAAAFTSAEDPSGMVTGVVTAISGNNLIVQEGTEGVVHYGYWTTAYQSVSSGSIYKVSQPNGLWVAGVPTPDSVISSLAGASSVFNYSGSAKALKVSGGSFSSLTGSTSATFDFGMDYLSGTISLSDGQTFDFDGSSGLTSEISGVIINAGIGTIDIGTEFLEGTIYGPNAEGIGGNFEVSLDNNAKRYAGVFIGNR